MLIQFTTICIYIYIYMYNFSLCLPFKYTVDKRPGRTNVHIFIAAGFIKHFIKNEFMLKQKWTKFDFQDEKKGFCTSRKWVNKKKVIILSEYIYYSFSLHNDFQAKMARVMVCSKTYGFNWNIVIFEKVKILFKL